MELPELTLSKASKKELDFAASILASNIDLAAAENASLNFQMKMKNKDEKGLKGAGKLFSVNFDTEETETTENSDESEEDDEEYDPDDPDMIENYYKRSSILR